jgi:hypothetical protein
MGAASFVKAKYIGLHLGMQKAREISFHFGNSDTVTIHIPDPWDTWWQDGVTSHIYPHDTSFRPSVTLFISRELVMPPTQSQIELSSNILEAEQTLHNQLPKDPSSTTLSSWIQIMQTSIHVLHSTSSINLTHCFFCAFLQSPLLATVPVNLSIPTPIPMPQNLNATPLCLLCLYGKLTQSNLPSAPAISPNTFSLKLASLTSLAPMFL